MPYEGRKGLRDGLLRVFFLQMFLCHKLKKSQIQAVDSLNQRLSSMVRRHFNQMHLKGLKERMGVCGSFQV